MAADIWFEKSMQVGQVFTPGSPVNARDLFAGRLDQLRSIISAASQSGYHSVLYGERGVGKTSLANILAGTVQPMGFLVARINCDVGDSFSTLWRKAFRDITYTETRDVAGFLPNIQQTIMSVADQLPLELAPDDVRRTLQRLGQHARVLVIMDEYDRLADDGITSALVSDTIKGLSDFGVNASVLLIGVADSVEQLVTGHQSIERALVQIPMPRMSKEEITTIFRTGLVKMGMSASDGACAHLVELSQGLPYIAHLLALNATKAALNQHSLHIERDQVDRGIANSLEQWQQSIKTAYYNAIKSQQPGAIYKEVLLACALAEVDELGYFTAAAVRGPLRSITGRQLDIPNFAAHLKQFSEDTRGKIILRTGTARRLRYRFVSPLMRPYVIMRGYSEGTL